MAISRLYNFTPNTVIQSSQVDAEYDQLVNALNGTSTDKDITMKLSHVSNPVLTLDQLSTGPIQIWKDNGTEKARLDDGGVLKLGHTQPNGGGGLNHLLSNLSATIVGTSSEDSPHVLEGNASERALDLIQASGNTPAFLACYERGSSTVFYSLLKHLMRLRAGGTQSAPISQSMAAMGTLTGFVSATDVGNVGPGEDDLHSFTLPANIFVNIGNDYLHCIFAGTTAANGNNKQIKFKFAGTTFFDTGVVTWNAKNWIYHVHIIMYDTDKLMFIGTFDVEGDIFHNATRAQLTGLTLTGTNVLKATGEATSDNDVVQSVTIIRKGTGA